MVGLICEFTGYYVQYIEHKPHLGGRVVKEQSLEMN